MSPERRLSRLNFDKVTIYLQQFAIRIQSGRQSKVIVEANKVGGGPPICFTKSVKTKRDREAVVNHMVELLHLGKRHVESLKLLLAAFR